MNNFDRISKAVRYIDDNLNDTLSVELIAEHFAFSSYYFHRLFTAVVGKSMMTYVRDRRVACACRMLNETDRKVLDIALDCGFDSAQSFSRAFRSVTGMSPTEYRDRKIVPDIIFAAERVKRVTDKLKGGIKMAVKILKVEKESCPAARLIGKRYEGRANWDEWWENNWFGILEAKPGLAINDHGYIGAVHIVDGMPERWIGMFYPENTPVPEGFDYVDIEPLNYAVCYLYAKDSTGEFFSMDTHNMCLEELKAHGFERKEDDWCFERYNCPRFTTPDENGNVILDYALSIR